MSAPAYNPWEQEPDPFGPREDRPAIPAVSWKGLPVGSVKTLEVTGSPEEAQETVYGTNDKAFWPGGDKKMAVVIPVIEDGEPRNYWIPVVNDRQNDSTFNRFRVALTVGGYKPLASGDVIKVKLSDQVPSGKGNPRNVFQFQITRATPAPADDPFGGADEAAPF